MLASWSDTMKNSPDPIRNYYRLLCIKANDKAYITHTSDTIIKSLVRYYEGDGDKRLLPEAYYYAGRVLRDMADAPQAIGYFEKALDVASDNNHLSLKSKIYSQMGRIFEYQNLPELSLEMTRKACWYDIQAGDDEALAYDLSDMAGLHWNCSRLDSAEFYYKAAISIMETLKDTLQTNMMKFELGYFYIDLKKYDEIENLLRPYLNHHYEFAKGYVYGGIAKYFLATQQWDSAQFYYNKGLEHGTIYMKRNAYWGFAQIAFARNNLEEGQYYLAQYDLCLDSIQKITSTQAVGQTHFGYNYELHEKENQRLKEASDRKQRYFTIILSVLGMILSGAVAYIIHHRRKKNPAIPTALETSPIPNILPNSYTPADDPGPSSTIEQPEKTPQTLLPTSSPRPSDGPDENEIGDRPIISVPASQEPAEDMPLPELHLYLLAAANKGMPLTEHEWTIVENTIRKNFPEFITKLCETHPCSTVELRTCMLIKLNVPPVNIAIFIGRSKEGVSSIRRRLCEKVFEGKGNSKKWDAFIHTL